MPSRCASSAPFPGWRRPSSPGSAASIATPSSIRQNCSIRRLRLKAMPRLRFAGQITGCEGYVESAAIGLLAGRFAAAERLGETIVAPPPTTAHGALLGHITGGHVETIDAGPRSFQPMNINFGLFPPLVRVPDTAARRRAPARPRQDHREETRDRAARARRSRSLDRRRNDPAGGRIPTVDLSHRQKSLPITVSSAFIAMKPG